MSEQNNKCSKCQTQLYDNSGKSFTWFVNEKHGNVCKNCLEKLDKQGELWDNFFRTACYTYSSSNSDPGYEGGINCNFCYEIIQPCQKHQWENGKLTVIKHNCQVECNPYHESSCGDKKFQLTQAYADLLFKYGVKSLYRCPDCQIKEVKKDVKNHDLYNQEKQKKDKEFLKELEKLTGKEGDNPQERERERERASWLISPNTVSNPLLYKGINF